MHLAIHTLKETLFDGEAKSLNAMTEAGEITVLDHHRPLISILRPCAIKIIDANAKELYINVSSGFLEVGENILRVIVEAKTPAVRTV